MEESKTPKSQNSSGHRKAYRAVKGGLCKAWTAATHQDVQGTLHHTLKDLRSDAREIVTLVGASFLPGGWIGYGAYRLRKYQDRKKSSNDIRPPL